MSGVLQTPVRGGLEVDQATIVVGLPKHGKTTVARREAKWFLETYASGKVLAHDLHEQLAPDLTAVYKTVDDWRRVQATNKLAPRGASFLCSSVDVVKLAIELGERHNTAKNVKVPIKVIFDETSLMATSGSTFMDKMDFQVFANRRHWGLAPLFNVQTQAALMRQFYEQATDVFIFAQTARNARELEDKLSLPRGALDQTVNEPPERVCPKYRCLHFKQGEGIISGW